MPGHMIVVGSINMDLVVRAERHPQPGETLLGSTFSTFPGGKGANQAVAAARLGTDVRMVGRVGSDAFGDELLTTLQRDGIDTSHVQRDVAASGVALITVDAAGQNTIVVVPGANGQLCEADVRHAAPSFAGAATLLLQLEIPLAVVTQAVALARQDNIRVILNAAPFQPLPTTLLSAVDDLIVNESELALLAGTDDQLVALQRLQARGARRIVVTLGSAGALVWEDGQVHTLPAQQVEVVDTTAAGDAFVGAYATALSEGQTAQRALQWGITAGALTITRAGAQPSLPQRDALEQLLRKVT